MVGGFLWAVGVTTLGYVLGDQIGAENIDKYLLPIIAVIILISVMPAVIEVLRKAQGDAGPPATEEVEAARPTRSSEILHRRLTRCDSGGLEAVAHARLGDEVAGRDGSGSSLRRTWAMKTRR